MFIPDSQSDIFLFNNKYLIIKNVMIKFILIFFFSFE